MSDTLAENSVLGGKSGSGGAGGKGGSSGLGDGAAGSTGSAGDASGGGGYVAGGSVSLYNSTVALNTQTGTGSGGGVVQVAGSVTAVSTLFAGNGAVDYAGAITANNCLFQTAPAAGTIVGAKDLTGVNPLFATAGLASNGGPTQTIALQAGSPAIGAGANPDNLFTDQRGYSPRGGAGTTDIGAYQHNAIADTTPPTAVLSAPAVTAANAGSLNPYTFTVTYADDTAIALSSLAGAVVDVSPPGGAAPITASVVSTSPMGPTDALGDAHGFLVSYEITPPGGTWSAADNGTYTVNLLGTPVTDVSGNAVAQSTLGSFSVNIVASQATATFLEQDAATQGNWIGVYGLQGYNVIDDTPKYPAGDTVTPSGELTYLDTTSTTSASALENPGGSGRIIAAWYSTTSFTIDVNLADGQAHDLELYFLDWNGRGRQEQVQIAAAGTGTVLDTEMVSSFSAGVYLDWKVSGNVVITITTKGGPNAVLSGLFIDPTGNPPPPPPPPSPTATFLEQDTATQGNWIGVYGVQGYNVIDDTPKYPTSDTVTPSGELTYLDTTSTTAASALENPGGSGRIIAAWYSTTSFTIDVNLADGQAHDLELYFLDWNSRGRQEQVQIAAAATGTVLDTEMVTSFSAGVYLDWKVSGNVVITITTKGGPNAVLSGLFIDPTGNPPPPPPSATATFLEQDTATQGNWIGVYGVQGYNVIDDTPKYPTGDTVTPSGELTYIDTTSTTSASALENPGGSGRIIAAWYSTTSFTIDVNLADGQAHDLELYFLDWNGRGRQEQVQIAAAATGTVLDTEMVSSFSAGVYLDWKVSGNVVITITTKGGPNAVLSGLFIDPVSGTAAVAKASAPSPFSVTAQPSTAFDSGSSSETTALAVGSSGYLNATDSGTVTAALGSNPGTTAWANSHWKRRHKPSRQEHKFLIRPSFFRTKNKALGTRDVALQSQVGIRHHPLVNRSLSF